MNTRKLLLLVCLFLCSGRALAQSAEKESAAVLELGGAAAWSFKDSAASFGPSVAVEVTPIENWLELEAGVTPLFPRHSTEWGTDLLFKKPWTLSRKTEFMFGVGPEWIHSIHYGARSNSVAERPTDNCLAYFTAANKLRAACTICSLAFSTFPVVSASTS